MIDLGILEVEMEMVSSKSVIFSDFKSLNPSFLGRMRSGRHENWCILLAPGRPSDLEGSRGQGGFD